MANNWFQFKEFKVLQDKCAMKVSTDACLQGALAVDFLLKRDLIIKNGLDIGTGSGLLSLMLVQKSRDLNMLGIEIEKQAVLQAQENFEASKWKNRLQASHISLQRFTENWKKNINLHQFDFIICNPPFFQNSLNAPQKERNIARHNVTLQLDDLLSCSLLLLKKDGIFSIMLPEIGWHDFLKSAEEKGLYLISNFKIHPKEAVKPNRNIAFFSSIKTTHPIDNHFIIYQSPGVYSEEFRFLLTDFYLNL